MAKEIHRRCRFWLSILTCILCTSAFVSSWGQQQPSNCGTLKEGRFQIDDYENGGVWTITRKAGVQREENETLGIAVEYLIEWIDDCTFRLLPYQVVRNDPRVELGGDGKFIVEIIEIFEDSFIQETTVWKTGQYITSEVKILR